LKDYAIAVVVVDPATLQNYADANKTTSQEVINTQDINFKKQIIDSMKSLAHER